MMQRILFVGLVVLASLCVSVPNLMAADVGRYQIVVVRGTSDEMVVVKLDTATGKTWVFDATLTDLADPEYLKTQGTADPLSLYESLEKNGLMAIVPPYWKEMPERAAGYTVKAKRLLK